MTSWKSVDIEVDANAAADVVLIPAGSDPLAAGSAESLGRVQAAIRSAGFDAREGHWLDVPGDESNRRLLVLGLGAPDGRRDPLFVAGGYLIDAMRALRIARARIPQFPGADMEGQCEAFVKGALLHGYRLDLGRHDPSPPPHPEALVIDAAQEAAAGRARAAVDPVNRARAWVEQPANRLTPTVFAAEAKAALEAAGLSVHVLDKTDLKKIGASALLAVASGSCHEPCLLIAEWRGDSARSEWDAAFVGKGVTFDSGGLNLKTRPVIEKMKFDMGGAAAVLGAAEMIGLRKSKANVVVIVPMTENSIGSAGYRPGDVIDSLGGLTIEVINTDAEGRLVLADGISYAIQNYGPSRIVDVATLTGMITGVLHEEYAGLYANDDDMAAALVAAGTDVGELLWRMPLSANQDYLVDSAVADVANMGAAGFLGLAHGSPAAGAKFLQRFVQGRSWAHVDIAGTAWATRRNDRGGAGATGFGVGMLDRWVAGIEPG